MLSAERRNRILAAVRAEGAVSIADLSQSLGVSVSTLRRDIDLLDGSGLLERTRGGAVSRVAGAKTFEPETAVRSTLALPEKRAIGQKAAELIQPGQTVLFDSGTTTLEAARAAAGRAIRFTAVTNDLTIAGLLSAGVGVDVVVPGGSLRGGTPTILGSSAIEFVGRLSVDLLLLGAHAVQEGRLSDTSIDLADLKRAMIAVAERRVLLADSSKFGRSAFAAFAGAADLHRVITDEGVAPAALAPLRAQAVAVDCVPLPARRVA
ncbi:MAG: DeoR/GlpR family DNA-binding transcription regulator [Alkalilacustris sp.]